MIRFAVNFIAIPSENNPSLVPSANPEEYSDFVRCLPVLVSPRCLIGCSGR